MTVFEVPVPLQDEQKKLMHKAVVRLQGYYKKFSNLSATDSKHRFANFRRKFDVLMDVMAPQEVISANLKLGKQSWPFNRSVKIYVVLFPIVARLPPRYDN